MDKQNQSGDKSNATSTEGRTDEKNGLKKPNKRSEFFADSLNGKKLPEIVIDKRDLKLLKPSERKSDRLAMNSDGQIGNQAKLAKTVGANTPPVRPDNIEGLKEGLVEKKHVAEITRSDYQLLKNKRGIAETGNLLKTNGNGRKYNITKSSQNVKLPTNGSKLTSPSLYSLKIQPNNNDVFSTNKNGVSQAYSTTEVNRIILAGNKNIRDANFANKSLASIAMGSTDGKKLFIRRVPTSPSELLNLNNNGQLPHVT